MDFPLTPLEFARRSRKLHAHREAVVDGTTRFTYEQFFERCDRWSAVLQQQLGVKQGDRVAVIGPNTHAMLEAFYAIPQLGAVVVPINYRLNADDFAYLLEHSGACVVCVHANHLEAVDAIRDRIPAVKHFVAFEGARPGWLDYETALQSGTAEFQRPVVSEDDLLTINYTSGTTSRPKGVMLTHRNAWINSIGTLLHQPLSMADRYLWTLPMFHVNGWSYVWTVTAAGATHVCLGKVDASNIFEQVREQHITVLCAAPTVLIMMANAPASLRRNAPPGVRVITGGAPPAPATIERLEHELAWQVRHVYGLTETAPFILMCDSRPEDANLNATARASIKARQGVELLTSGELLVVDSAGSEVPHDAQTLGEIIVRGNSVMKGYYRDPAATAQALRDGWFHTGDAAVVHADGYVEIRDRFKDVIISGGENVSSIEVERTLLHHPDVVEAAVVGVTDEKWGETPHAFVVLRTGSEPSRAGLREFCRERLAHFKVPSQFSFVTDLPKTATGKIQKFVLRGSSSAIHRQ